MRRAMWTSGLLLAAASAGIFGCDSSMNPGEMMKKPNPFAPVPDCMGPAVTFGKGGYVTEPIH